MSSEPAWMCGSTLPVRSCYQSSRRARAAADTRATILATAMRLFLERGYGG